eukprot:1642601-Rhodomonas_salina.1
MSVRGIEQLANGSDLQKSTAAILVVLAAQHALSARKQKSTHVGRHWPRARRAHENHFLCVCLERRSHSPAHLVAAQWMFVPDIVWATQRQR